MSSRSKGLVPQAFRFPLANAMVGTIHVSSQQHHRSVHKTSVVLTLKTDLQLTSGVSRASSHGSDFVLLLHAQAQQLERLYLKELVQTTGRPIPYNFTLKDARKAFRLVYEPTAGDQREIGVEFSKRSDYNQAKQVLERCGLVTSPSSSSLSARLSGETQSLRSISQVSRASPAVSSPDLRSRYSAYSHSSLPLFGSSPSPASPRLDSPFPDSFSQPSPNLYSPALASTRLSSARSQPQLHAQNLYSNFLIAQDKDQDSLFGEHRPERPFHSGMDHPVLRHNWAATGGNEGRAFRDISATHNAAAIDRPSSALSQSFQELGSMLPPRRELPFSRSSRKSSSTTPDSSQVPPMSRERANNWLNGSAANNRDPYRSIDHVSSLSIGSETQAKRSSEHEPGSDKRQRLNESKNGFARSPGNGGVTSPVHPTHQNTATQVDLKLPLARKCPERETTGAQSPTKSHDHSSGEPDHQESSNSRNRRMTRRATKNALQQPRTTKQVSNLLPEETACWESKSTQTHDARNLIDAASFCDLKPKSCTAATQIYVPTSDAAISCYIQMKNCDRGAQTTFAVGEKGTFCDIRPPHQHNAVQTDSWAAETWRTDSLERQLEGPQAAQAQPEYLTAATQSDMVSTEKDCTPRIVGGRAFAAGWHLVDEVRCVAHKHRDSVLKRYAMGLDVDLEHSEKMLEAEVEELTRCYLKRFGPVLFDIPFESILMENFEAPEAVSSGLERARSSIL